jgi:hypothetical protein
MAIEQHQDRASAVITGSVARVEARKSTVILAVENGRDAPMSLAI